MSTDRAAPAAVSDQGVPDQRVLRGVCARARDTVTLDQFTSQGERCGWCSQPIRLVGSQRTVDRSTGEVVRTYSTASEPDGVLLKACGTRRATRCPSCAATYGADARMLVRSGLSGGKGVPESVSEHPMVFATFTAPSFGAVHGTRPGSGNHPCRPGVRGRHCAHGRPVACWARHGTDDPTLGEPLCPDCYDYERAVLWNATCPELWRRTTIYIRRELARLSGITTKELRQVVRLSFAKVAEYQRRGVVHLHAVIRIDGADDDRLASDGCTDSDNSIASANYRVPPALFDTTVLTAAIRTAASKVATPFPADLYGGSSGAARWGTQIDVRAIIDRGEESEADARPTPDDRQRPASAGARAVANYVAKYATKSTDGNGALDRRLRSLDDLDARGVTGHLRRLVETAWRLGARPELATLRQWAHTLGFGGHWLTKSRRYSVTFGYLRAERQAWQIRRHAGRAADPSEVSIVADWEWIGTGWRTRGDAWLATVGQKAKARSRMESREARCIGGSDE